jgi:hypothetical protein
MLLALTGLGIGQDAQPTESQLAPLLAALHKPEFLSSETQEYREILTELIARSGLRLKVNINGPTQPNALNFLLLASDLNERTDVPLVFFTPLAQKSILITAIMSVFPILSFVLETLSILSLTPTCGAKLT